MGYSAKILADSLSPLGDRLTSFEITFPRIVLSEFNTHRMFSRNSASSRAIPVKKMLQRVLEDPFIPIYWGKNQSGMQAETQLSHVKQAQAREIWLEALTDNVLHVIELQIGQAAVVNIAGDLREWSVLLPLQRIAALQKIVTTPDLWSEEASWLNVHKQIANRLLEPWMWHTVIVTTTEWSNFFALRTEASAQPEISRIAEMMHELYHEHMPAELGYDDWHLPLVKSGEFDDTDISPQVVSTGRCCRVSYLTHDGKRDPDKDIEIHDNLLKNGHMSPFEHPARPMNVAEKRASPWSGNFYGWVQYRKTIEHEADFSQVSQDLEGSTWCEDCLAIHIRRAN